MTENEELLRVPGFADLPNDQIEWSISQAKELRLKAGDALINAGDTADAMFVLLEGQLQARGEIGGETVIITVNTGQVTGRLPFSRMKTFTFGARALTDCRILRYPESKYHDLIQKMP